MSPVRVSQYPVAHTIPSCKKGAVSSRSCINRTVKVISQLYLTTKGAVLLRVSVVLISIWPPLQTDILGAGSQYHDSWFKRKKKLGSQF